MNICPRLIILSLFLCLPIANLFSAQFSANLEQAIDAALDAFDTKVTHLDSQADRAIRAKDWDKAYEIMDKLGKLSTDSSNVFSGMPLSDTQQERLITIVNKSTNLSIKLTDAGIE